MDMEIRTMPTTIGRNRRQYVINVKSEYTECRKLNPDTGKMDRCDGSEAWAVLEDDGHRSARLIEDDDRTVYTIRYRELLFELRKPSSRAQETDCPGPA